MSVGLAFVNKPKTIYIGQRYRLSKRKTSTYDNYGTEPVSGRAVQNVKAK